MSALDKITVCDDRKRPRVIRTSSDPIAMRRKKFSGFLEDQRAVAEGNYKKKNKKQRAAFWEDSGTYYFKPRYGTAPVAIKDGKSICVAGATIKDVVKLIDVLFTATNAGELDNALAIAAEKKRKSTQQSVVA